MTKPIPAETHLARVEAQARENTERGRRLVAGLSPDDLLWRPEPSRWGVADCLEHLISTGSAYHPRVQGALAKAPPPPRTATYRPRVLGRLFLRGAGPEAPVRIRARGPFAPGPPRPDAFQRFEAQQEELLELIERAGRADLQRTSVPSPLTRLLTLTLGECLEMLVQHQVRHLDQAKRVLTEAGHPDPDAGA